jgi:uncharacterized coiled-coil protein SlyX
MAVVWKRCAILQALAESRAGELEDHVRHLKTQMEELSHQLMEANALKARLSQENYELHNHMHDLDTDNAALAKAKTAMIQELDDLKIKADEETRVDIQ